MNTKYSNTETFDSLAPLKVDSVTIERIPDDSPDSSYLEQEGWEERLVEFRSGRFGFMGIRAKATVSRPIGQGNRRIETFTSSGLWGIEDDSSEDDLKEAEDEEFADLASHLSAFGIETTAETLRELAN